MRKLEVGKLFEEGKTKYPEGCKFDFNNSGGSLFIFFNNPTEEEIKEITKGKSKIGITTKNNIIFMMFKLGSLEVMDCPYNKYLSQDFDLEALDVGAGYSITIYLIDASNGILKGIRLISMTTKFSVIFKKEIKNQNEINNYQMVLNNIYNNYTTKQLWQYAEIMKVGEN